ncbi:MAG: hypothetical protein JJU07_02535 [Natronohydrobacter sp.]|nr:hypothetical protein [Natronohydrobacter sp.]
MRLKHAIRTACLSAAVGALSAASALACMPSEKPLEPDVRGPDCAFAMDVSRISTVSLSSAEPLGERRYLQTLSDGQVCEGSKNLVVHDCAAGKMLIIGTEFYHAFAMPREDDRHIHKVREAALKVRDQGIVPDFAMITSLSQAEGFGEPKVLRINQRLQFERRTLRLDCVCRTLDRRS